jgi:excisionase family DNA binding protein
MTAHAARSLRMNTPLPHRPQPLPDVLTIEEAAALLRVNHKTLRDAIHRNEVPGVVRLGRVIRLSRTALIEWFRASAVLRSGVKQ